jgi:hypothetical protein
MGSIDPRIHNLCTRWSTEVSFMLPALYPDGNNHLYPLYWSLGKFQNQAVPWLRRLVASLSPRRPGFDPGSVHVRFVVDKVALGQFFLRIVGFPLSVSFHRCSINCKTW